MNRWMKWLYAMENNQVLAAIKKGFLLVLPVVMTGSFALLLRSFPIAGYQEWLASFGGGCLLALLNFIYDSTVGFMSLYLVMGISYYYSYSLAEKDATVQIMSMVASIACFIASFGGASGSLEIACFGTIGVFSAMLCSILATRLFIWMDLRLFRRFRSYAAGADLHFRNSIAAILPMAVCVALFALGNLLLQQVFHVGNLNDLISGALFRAFGNLKQEPGNGLVFLLLQSLLWAFGIHGGNALDPVGQVVFTVGDAGTGFVISKSFLDNFAAIGGSGVTLCLLLALLIASRQSSNRRLAYSSAPLALFNINEILVFGLPIVLNPTMVIPFVLVPVLSMLIAYGAVVFGLMPPVTHSVIWTTPVFFSGYLATDSWRGAAVQLVIVAAGTLLYIPFVRLSERLQVGQRAYMLGELTQDFLQKGGEHTNYLDRHDKLGVAAKSLVGQLRADVSQGSIPVFYQPQVDAQGRVVGAEALLRWQYAGKMVAPPLAVALAQEDGCFDELTWVILATVCRDIRRMEKQVGRRLQVSANIVAEQLNDPRFVQRAIELAQQEGVAQDLVLEVTEESSLDSYPNIGANIDQLGSQGIQLAIDDFSMGQTSLRYLRSNRFRYVKLDGGLVRQLADNARIREIVSSIIALGHNLGFLVVAEWVENRQLRDVLAQLGCTLFQGYYYSPAVPFEEMVAFSRAKEDREA